MPEYRQDEASCPRRLAREYYAEMMEMRRRALAAEEECREAEREISELMAAKEREEAEARRHWARAKQHGGATRFCGTEAGMPTILSKDFHHNAIAGNNFRSSYARQAAVITRFYLLTRLTGMDFLCQYNWMDEGDDPKYTEHNFGQIFKDATPKPSFVATATLARVLGKADVVGEKSPEPEKWRMGEFVREDKTIYACWSVEGGIKVDWPSALEGAKFVDLMGNEIPAPKTEDGKLRLDDSPVYAVCTR